MRIAENKVSLSPSEMILFQQDNDFFQEVMRYMPEEQKFSNYAEYIKNAEARLKFCEVLRKAGNRCGLFNVSDKFINEFVYRND